MWSVMFNSLVTIVIALAGIATCQELKQVCPPNKTNNYYIFLLTFSPKFESSTVYLDGKDKKMHWAYLSSQATARRRRQKLIKRRDMSLGKKTTSCGVSFLWKNTQNADTLQSRLVHYSN